MARSAGCRRIGAKVPEFSRGSLLGAGCRGGTITSPLQLPVHCMALPTRRPQTKSSYSFPIRSEDRTAGARPFRHSGPEISGFFHATNAFTSPRWAASVRRAAKRVGESVSPGEMYGSGSPTGHPFAMPVRMAAQRPLSNWILNALKGDRYLVQHRLRDVAAPASRIWAVSRSWRAVDF